MKKNNLRQFMIKLWALTLAIIMAFPFNAFASSQIKEDTKSYDDKSSIMGLAEDNEKASEENINSINSKQDYSKNIEDRGKYSIEKKASLSKDSSKLIYTIELTNKDFTKEESQGDISLALGFDTSSNIKNIEVKNIEGYKDEGSLEKIQANSQQDSSLDPLQTLTVTSKNYEKLLYTIEADISSVDDKATYSLIMSLNKDDENIYLSTYDLRTDIINVTENNTQKELVELVDISEDNNSYLDAFYKEDKELIWQDYLVNDKEDSKKVRYDLNSDNNQDFTDSKINLEYLSLGKDGFEKNEELSQSLDYVKNLEFDIPKGYMVKLSLKSQIDKDNTSIKNYSMNNRTIKNPYYKEDKESSDDSDDESAQQDIDENKNLSKKDATDAKNKVTVKADPDSNEFVIDEPIFEKKDKSSVNATESQSSAIDLNKDSILSKYKSKGNLSPVLEVTINNITSLLKSYNDDKISYEDFENELSSQTNDISKQEFTEITSTLIEGLNEEKYKVAKIDIDSLANQVYSDDNIDKQSSKSLDKVDTNSQNDNTNKESQEIPLSSEEIAKQDAVESFDSSLRKAAEEAKKPQEDDRTLMSDITEGVKGIFGQSNLDKADKELKEALDNDISLEKLQDLLLDLGERYNLNSKDEAKLMSDNEEAIKAVIEKDADANFRSNMLFVQNDDNISSFTNKSFNILTNFDTYNADKPVRVGEKFVIQLDDKLKINDSSVLENLSYKGNVVANASYDEKSNTIIYTVVKDIYDSISLPIKIKADYNIDNIDKSKESFAIINRISGVGLSSTQSLLPIIVDKNGNISNTIDEPDKENVIQIINQDKDEDYRFTLDAYGQPVINNGKMNGVNWTIKVGSDQDLKSLGYKLNLTTVEGSGIGEIQNSRSNTEEINLETNEAIKGKLGIVDSKHYNLQSSAQDLVQKFYTPVINEQSSYMLDISVALTEKKETGAVRLIMDDGYLQQVINEATPTRVGMNNRTTIQGEFTSSNEARWTITDGVSTGDSNNGLPLKSRSIGSNQSIKEGKTASYGLDENGKMEIKEGESFISEIPSKETNPSSSQAVGNIAVYQLTTDLKDPDKAQTYILSGVELSKYRNLYIDQSWNLPDGVDMPEQTIKAVDKDGNILATSQVEAGEDGKFERLITVDDVRYWNITDEGKASKTDPKIDQNFSDQSVEINGKEYRFYENTNYYNPDQKIYYIKNSLSEENEEKSASFNVLKVDRKNPGKRLAGARYKLLGSDVEAVTDTNGRALFSNIKPGSYTLVESKAPSGYELDQESKNINISKDGEISVSGRNAYFSDASNKTEIVRHPGYPDYMTTMRYGNISDNGNVEFYLYLKPLNSNGGSTNKDTRLNIDIPGALNLNVSAYDVYPEDREAIRAAMENQTVDKNISSLGKSVINSPNNNVITGKENVTDSYTNKTGYQIKFPAARFNGDWGFLVKVTGNIKDMDSAVLYYDWLTDKNTVNEAKIQENINISKQKLNNNQPSSILITNEEYDKSIITVSKFDDSKDKNKLKGAEFVLKDSDGNIISTKFTGEDGQAKFGEQPAGTYTIEEANAPQGYEKSNAVFDIIVNKSGEIIYNPRFKNGSGVPENAIDYWLENEKDNEGSSRANVVSVNQKTSIKEGVGSGSSGIRQDVWEAYRLESLKYHLDVSLKDSREGSKFEIQFDPNLDFTQYVNELPKINVSGKDIADPYFDYNTNLLTYVFNNNSGGGPIDASIDIVGIIPSKFYAKSNGEYSFTNIVNPGADIKEGNQREDFKINADYEIYDMKSGQPSQSYYFRDVYQGEDGQWYVSAIAYYNATADYSGTSKKLSFNWLSTNYQKDTRYANWQANGEKPAFDLEDIKIYRTEPKMRRQEIRKDYSIPINDNMPLSFGIRPEQDPNTYSLVYSTKIDSSKSLNNTSNNIKLDYNPGEIQTTGVINRSSPLEITMPAISRNNEGYVIEQTFKVTDKDKFNKLWRAFYMTNGSLESPFVSRSNTNDKAEAIKTGDDIPVIYKQRLGFINKKYTPGKFYITKINESDRDEKINNAVFSLTDTHGNIYRSTNKNGRTEFNNLAPGRYTLIESKAPDNFIKSDKKWQVTVDIDGNVKILETSVTGYGKTYQGNNTDPINLEVTNKPASDKFVIYKKDPSGKPLAGAKFRISKQNSDPEFVREAVSDENGIVKLKESLSDGTYIIEEIEAPKSYKKSDKKWVLVVNEGKNKLYNYVDPTKTLDVKSIPAEDGVSWVDVKNRDTTGWSQYDVRWTGWTRYSNEASKLGTRIVAINKDKKYVVQRYVINPESASIGESSAIIHRENSQYDNMDWYQGTEDYNVFILDKPVTGLISDIRLANYGITDISKDVKKDVVTSGQDPDSLKLTFPETNKPILVDIKVPYKEESAGVGTSIDFSEGGEMYWKSDYYEKVSDIKLAEPTHAVKGNIKGSYISDDSLDITNESKKYDFKIKKVKENDKDQTIKGAIFKLTGPDDTGNIDYMTTADDGMIIFDDLEQGTYTLEEDRPAPGYEKSDTTWAVIIGDDGKTYIKEDKSVVANRKVEVKEDTAAQNIEELAISRFSMANISFMAVNQNLGLEESPIAIASPQMAASGWQKVDPAMSKTSSKSDSANGEIKTKITEINKDTKQFKQVFLIDGSKSTLSPIILNIHRVGLAEIKPTDISVSVYPVSKDSTVDNLTSIGGPIKYNGPFGDNNFPGVTLNFVKQNQNIAIEVTSSYSTGSPIGLEMYYHYSRSGSPANWKHFDAKESYANENDVNKIESYKVTINQPQNGSIDADKKTDLKKDDTVRLTKQANNGYIFKEWNVRDAQGNPVTVSNDQFKMPASDVTVSAVFEKIPSYQVWVQTVEGGKVTPNPNKDVTAGTTINLTIEPEDGYELEKITYNDLDGKTYEVNGTSFEMPNHNVTLMPTFKKKPVAKYNITLMQAEGGNISADPMSAEKGTIIKLTASADEGYEFEGFTVTDANNESVDVTDGQFVMPASNVSVSARFNKKEEPDQVPEGFTEIPEDGFAEIPNRQIGLDLKINKQDLYGSSLEGAIFSLKKTDRDYKAISTEKEFRAISQTDGSVVFKDDNEETVKLEKGYYLLEEVNAPLGYKKSQAPWKIAVKEDNGRMYAEYLGPEETLQNFLNSDNAKASDGGLKVSKSGIKYDSRVTYINTQAKSFIQRVYIDTRGYKADDIVNVQINPVIKRDEIEDPGKTPKTNIPGVKTAYRASYKVSDISGDPSQEDVDNILSNYDLSNSNISMVNTARWRPFDWGFDEDQLNLESGVYFIDIEGYYDDNIIEEGQIDIDIDFYKGERKFQQAKGKDDNGNIIYNEEDGGSYQTGNELIGLGSSTDLGQSKANENDKYNRWLGKEGGRIWPSLDEGKIDNIRTSINISPIYTSSKANPIPEEGMTITNEEESYNITFSKHGRDDASLECRGRRGN